MNHFDSQRALTHNPHGYQEYCLKQWFSAVFKETENFFLQGRGDFGGNFQQQEEDRWSERGRELTGGPTMGIREKNSLVVCCGNDDTDGRKYCIRSTSLVKGLDYI